MACITQVMTIQEVELNSTNHGSEVMEVPQHITNMLPDGELTMEQRTQTTALLGRYVAQFPAPGDPITGNTDALLHDIDTGNTKLVRTPLIQLSPTKIQEQEIKVAEMLRGGQIEPSDSLWSSPTVMVKKKDGTLRFCVNYRRLHCVTKKDASPLPTINNSLSMLADQRWFSTLDLASGYWQVGLTNRAKERSAFATPAGLFQFKVMPFGLCNAPATFERLMSQVLRGLQWEHCLVYIDDILVFGRSFDSSLDNLRSVLDRIAQYGLQLKSSKCALLRSSLPFLGHVVSRDGLQCNPEKIEPVNKWSVPTSVKAVHEFLEFTGYYRRFGPNFDSIAEPLNNLMEKTGTFHWNGLHQRVFDKLCHRLTSAPVLAFPRGDLEYTVDCDASNYGIGGVLLQVQDGAEHVIAYYSHALRESQRKYCTTKK